MLGERKGWRAIAVAHQKAPAPCRTKAARADQVSSEPSKGGRGQDDGTNKTAAGSAKDDAPLGAKFTVAVQAGSAASGSEEGQRVSAVSADRRGRRWSD